MQLQHYSPEEEQLLLRMRSENKTIKDIAAAIGRSPKSVEKKWISPICRKTFSKTRKLS